MKMIVDTHKPAKAYKLKLVREIQRNSIKKIKRPGKRFKKKTDQHNLNIILNPQRCNLASFRDLFKEILKNDLPFSCDQ